jgi:hypothetical protein
LTARVVAARTLTSGDGDFGRSTGVVDAFPGRFCASRGRWRLQFRSRLRRSRCRSSRSPIIHLVDVPRAVSHSADLMLRWPAMLSMQSKTSGNGGCHVIGTTSSLSEDATGPIRIIRRWAQPCRRQLRLTRVRHPRWAGTRALESLRVPARAFRGPRVVKGTGPHREVAVQSHPCTASVLANTTGPRPRGRCRDGRHLDL